MVTTRLGAFFYLMSESVWALYLVFNLGLPQPRSKPLEEDNMELAKAPSHTSVSSFDPEDHKIGSS